jgi:hypothetical protein
MDDDAIDALLRDIPDDAPCSASYDDGRLLAITRGASDDELDARLASDPEGRALLAALVEPVPNEVLRRAEQAVVRRRRNGPLVAGVVVLAAAAALLLVTRPWEQPAIDSIAYSVEGPLGGVRATRGAEPATTRFLPHSRLRLVVRPHVEPSGDAPVLRVFAVREDRIVEMPRRGITSGRGGAARLEIRVGEVLEDAGRWDLHVLLVPPHEDRSVTSADDLRNVRAVDRHVFVIEYELDGR